MNTENNVTFTVLQCLAKLYNSLQSAIKADNYNHKIHFGNAIEKLIKNYFPNGSGIDAGCSFNFDRSKPDKFVINFSYHFMNDSGYYDGWKDYVLTITPDFERGFNLKLTGSNKNDIKDYLIDVFDFALERKLSQN